MALYLNLCRSDMEQLAVLTAIAVKKIATPRYAVALTRLNGNNVVELTDQGQGNLTPTINNYVQAGAAGSITFQLVDGGEVTQFLIAGGRIEGHFKSITATDIYPLIGYGSMTESSIRV